MDMEIFGRRLKEVRTSQNVSAVELSEAIGVNVGTIHRYEKAEFKSIKEDRLEAISSYLSVDKNYLIGKTDERYNFNTLLDIHKNQKIEITNIIYITKDILKKDKVLIDSVPLTEDDIRYLNDLMDITLEMIRKRHNE